jgi:FtsZ-interacting cell division protein ZipA
LNVETWVIVLIVIAVVVVLALLALTLAKRSRVANVKKREKAREHLQEAQVLQARAGKDQALAEEQAARARRERAEAEERTALAEQEARERAARAGEQHSEAERLRAQAEKLAPGMTTDTRREPPTNGQPAEDWSQPAQPAHGTAQYPDQYPDQPEGGATRR